MKSFCKRIKYVGIVSYLAVHGFAAAGPLPAIYVDNLAAVSISQGQVVQNRSGEATVGADLVTNRVAVSAVSHTESTPVFSAQAMSTYSVGATPTAANAAAFSTNLYYFDVLSSNRDSVNLELDFLYSWTSSFNSDYAPPSDSQGPINGGALWAVLSTRDGALENVLSRHDFLSCQDGRSCEDSSTIDDAMLTLSTNTVYALQITSYSRTFNPTTFQIGTAFSAVHLGIGPESTRRGSNLASDADYRLTLSEGVGNAPLNAVPEPASWALLAAAGLGWIAGRRTR